MSKFSILLKYLESKLLYDYEDGKQQHEFCDEVSYASVFDSIKICTKCLLHQKRNHAVPGEGVVHEPLVMVVGEAPGAREDMEGKPFVGKAGQYLDRWLKAIGLSRQKNVYITNVIKCRPPGNRTPYPTEVQACTPYLHQQIRIIKPRYLLALGLPAANFLWKHENRMGDIHGRWGEYESIPFLATYHPSAVLRNPYQLRPKVWEDLQILKRVIKQHVH